MSTAGKSDVSKTSEEEAHEFTEQVTGISLLTFALIVSSGMGLIQEKTYAEHGKHPSEALFINHVLGLPLFYFSRESISTAFNTLLNTEPVNVTNNVFPDWNMPIGIVYLIINCLTSYACIRSVFILTTECTSLTVTRWFHLNDVFWAENTLGQKFDSKQVISGYFSPFFVNTGPIFSHFRPFR